jgi:hypothetical protein
LVPQKLPLLPPPWFHAPLPRWALLAIAFFSESEAAHIMGVACVTVAAFLAILKGLTQDATAVAHNTSLQAIPLRFRPVPQPEAGQRHAREANAEFLQRPAPRNRLGHALGGSSNLLFMFFLLFGCLFSRRSANEVAGVNWP